MYLPFIYHEQGFFHLVTTTLLLITLLLGPMFSGKRHLPCSCRLSSVDGLSLNYFEGYSWYAKAVPMTS